MSPIRIFCHGQRNGKKVKAGKLQLKLEPSGTLFPVFTHKGWMNFANYLASDVMQKKKALI